MKRRTLVVTVTLLFGLLALLIGLLSQLRHSTTATPRSWPPLLLAPCTPTTVYLDQQLFADDGLPAVAQALAESWQAQDWSTQLDVSTGGQAALLTGQRAGQYLKAAFEQKPDSVHLVASGEQHCDPSARGDTAFQWTRLTVSTAPSGENGQTAFERK